MQGVVGVDSGEDSGGGSMSTVSREENLVWSSEDSSCPDESELDLGLGLSLGGGGFKSQKASRPCQYGRILTAKDLPSSSPSSASSSSSPSLSRANVTAGVKRTSDSAANGSSQVVGWPPVRALRVNSMANQAKTVATEGFSQTFNKIESKNTEAEKQNLSCLKDSGNAKRSSLFVKVNMDGTPIGRKVDLNSHGCYETLAKSLEAMFLSSTTSMGTRRSSENKNGIVVDAMTSPKLLNGLAEFVLTYEDKDGDWMLVGDVPWGMFISSVKRLRIMRTSEATGLAPRLQQGSERQRNKLI